MLVTNRNYIMFVKHNISDLQFGFNSIIPKERKDRKRNGKGVS